MERACPGGSQGRVRGCAKTRSRDGVAVPQIGLCPLSPWRWRPADGHPAWTEGAWDNQGSAFTAIPADVSGHIFSSPRATPPWLPSEAVPASPYHGTLSGSMRTAAFSAPGRSTPERGPTTRLATGCPRRGTVLPARARARQDPGSTMVGEGAVHGRTGTKPHLAPGWKPGPRGAA